MAAVASMLTSGVKKMTNVVKNAAEQAKNQLQNEAKKDIIYDPTRDYGALWEKNENVEHCRGCNDRFDNLVTNRKHHCRSCAGVFCNSCCPEADLTSFNTSLLPTTFDTSTVNTVRLCSGCTYGECPSLGLKQLIRTQLDEQERAKFAGDSDKDGHEDNVLFDKSIDKHFAKFHQKVLGKINEAVGLYDNEDAHPLRRLKLAHGSYFGEDGKPSKNTTNKPLPTAGYLEIFNKSEEVICVKILYSGKNLKFEIPRPSYIAVPPQDTIYAFFNPNCEALEIMMLYNNPHSANIGRSIVHLTRAPDANPERISKCAQVREFQNVALFNVQCKSRNVLLKYKGRSNQDHTSPVLQPRNGSSMSRVGFFGALQGLRTSNNKIDFSSNVNEEGLIFRCTLHADPIAPN